MGCRKLSYYPESALEMSRLKITEGLREKKVQVKKCDNYYPFGLTMAEDRPFRKCPVNIFRDMPASEASRGASKVGYTRKQVPVQRQRTTG